MRTFEFRLVLLAVFLSTVFEGAATGETPSATAFTYQGQLKQNDVPTTATCDCEFRLWNDPDSTLFGNQVGAPITFDGGPGNSPPIDVVNGLFQVELVFGADAFNGDARWLEIDVCCASPCAPAYTTLVPRQLITATPYALQTRGIVIGEDGNVVFNSMRQVEGTVTFSSIGGIDVILDADTNNMGEDQNARIVMKQDGGLVVARMGYRELANKLEIMQEYNDNLVLGTNNEDRLTILSNGNVGIGTSNPGKKLQVNGDLRVDDRVGVGTSTTGLGRVVIEQDGGTRDDGLTVTRVTDRTRTVRLFLDDSGTRHLEGGDRLALNAANNGNIDLATGGGNVGIATSSPQETLHVNGNLRVDGDIVFPVRKGYVSISPVAFRDIERTTIDFQSSIPRVGNTAIGVFSALANVHLPVGATVTALRASVDNQLSDSNAGFLVVTLYRSQIGFSLGRDQLASVSGGLGRDYISTTNILNAVVHFAHSYYVDFHGVVTSSGSPNSMFLYGVTIEYEVSEVLP